MCATIARRISGGVGARRRNMRPASNEELLERCAMSEADVDKLIEEKCALTIKLEEAETEVGRLNLVVAGFHREDRSARKLYLT